MKKLFVLDWDDSLRVGYSAIDWVKKLKDSNLFVPQEYLRMNKSLNSYRNEKIGYNEFVNSYADIYFKGILPYDTDDISKCLDLFVEQEIKENLSDYTLNLISFLEERHYDLLVISGSPQMLVERIFKRLAKNTKPHVHGINPYNNKYSGSLEVKSRIFRTNMDKYNLIGSIGDSPSDYEITRYSDFGFIVGDKVKSSLFRVKNINHQTKFIVLKNHIEKYESNATNNNYPTTDEKQTAAS